MKTTSLENPYLEKARIINPGSKSKNGVEGDP
jgi:hypothetical protein